MSPFSDNVTWAKPETSDAIGVPPDPPSPSPSSPHLPPLPPITPFLSRRGAPARRLHSPTRRTNPPSPLLRSHIARASLSLFGSASVSTSASDQSTRASHPLATAARGGDCMDNDWDWLRDLAAEEVAVASPSTDLADLSPVARDERLTWLDTVLAGRLHDSQATVILDDMQGSVSGRQGTQSAMDRPEGPGSFVRPDDDQLPDGEEITVIGLHSASRFKRGDTGLYPERTEEEGYSETSRRARTAFRLNQPHASKPPQSLHNSPPFSLSVPYHSQLVPPSDSGPASQEVSHAVNLSLSPSHPSAAFVPSSRGRDGTPLPSFSRSLGYPRSCSSTEKRRATSFSRDEVFFAPARRPNPSWVNMSPIPLEHYSVTSVPLSISPVRPSLPALEDGRPYSYLSHAAADPTRYDSRSLHLRSSPLPSLPPPWAFPNAEPLETERTVGAASPTLGHANRFTVGDFDPRLSPTRGFQLSESATYLTRGYAPTSSPGIERGANGQSRLATSKSGSIQRAQVLAQDSPTEARQKNDRGEEESRMEGGGRVRKRARKTAETSSHPQPPARIPFYPAHQIEPDAEFSEEEWESTEQFWGPFRHKSNLIDKHGQVIKYTTAISEPPSIEYDIGVASWLTYKKNHFSFAVELGFDDSTSLAHVRTSNNSASITHFEATLDSSAVPHGSPVDLLQFDSSRTVANATSVQPQVLTSSDSQPSPPRRRRKKGPPGVSPSSRVSTEFARIQFRSATAKRFIAGSEPAEPTHYRNRVTLVAVHEDERETEIGTWTSARLVVRAKHPASFEQSRKKERARGVSSDQNGTLSLSTSTKRGREKFEDKKEGEEDEARVDKALLAPPDGTRRNLRSMVGTSSR